MNKKKLAAIAAAAAMLIPSAAAVADQAYTVYPDVGGEWQYGEKGVREAWSNYWHGDRGHGSEVRRGWWDVSRSPDIAAGNWSYARLRWKSVGTYSWYFHVV